MKKVFAISALTVSLSACSVPGMHMDQSNLTPELNAKGQTVQPTVTNINAKLIAKQIEQNRKQQSFEQAHYHQPKGFTVDHSGYHYIVGPQDVLRIIVWNHPELNNPANTQSTASIYDVGFTVDTQGDIYYPYIGSVHVAGLSTGQIRELLTPKLALYIKKPQVNVTVMKFNSQHIDVTGAVKTPRVIPVTNVPVTVLSAVTSAGGPINCGNNGTGQNGVTLCADVQKVAITRKGETHYINLNTLRTPVGTSDNWILQNGDVVNVPNNNQSRVFVLGAVNMPGAYNMVDGKMTLQQAIGDARGPNMLSDPSYTYVIRNYNDQPQIYLLDAHSADALILASRFMLKPQDVIFISNAKIANFNAVLNQILPTLNTATSIKFLTN